MPESIESCEDGNPSPAGNWFGVEEVEPGYWFGYIQGAFDEWGYFSMEEMAPLIKQGLIWPIKPQDLPYAGRRRR